MDWPWLLLGAALTALQSVDARDEAESLATIQDTTSVHGLRTGCCVCYCNSDTRFTSQGPLPKYLYLVLQELTHPDSGRVQEQTGYVPNLFLSLGFRV